MALRDTWVTIGFSKGINTEDSDKLLNPDTPTEVLNGTWSGNALSKRPGHTLLDPTYVGGPYARSQGFIAGASRGDEEDLTAFTTDNKVLSRLDDRWFPVGDWVHHNNEVIGLPYRPYGAFDPCTAGTGSNRIIVWEDTRGGIYAHYWSDDRQVATSREFRVGGGSGKAARVVEVNNRFHVYFLSGTNLEVGVLSVSDPTTLTASLRVVASDFVGVDSFKAHSGYPLVSPFDVVTVGTSVACAWATSGNLKVGIVSDTGFIGGTGVTTVAIGAGFAASGPSLALSADQTQLAMTWLPTSQFVGAGNPACPNTAVFTTLNLTSLGSVFPLNSGLASSSMGVVQSFSTNYGSAISPYDLHGVFQVAGTDSALPINEQLVWSRAHVSPTGSLVDISSGSLKRHSRLASKPFPMSGTMAVWAYYPEPTQPTEFLVTVPGGLSVNHSRDSHAFGNVSGSIPAVDVRGNQSYRAVVDREFLNVPTILGPSTGPQNLDFSTGTLSSRSLKLVRTDYQTQSSLKCWDVDGELLIPGGWLGMYDGSSVVEVGFAQDAVVDYFNPLTSASYVEGGIPPGPNSFPGVYTWLPVYEWTSAVGKKQVSYGVPVQATITTAVNTAQLFVRTLTHTAKDNVTIALYRSAVNDPSTLTRIAEQPNDPNADLVSFTDHANAAKQAAAPELYSVGEVPNSMPPGCRYVISCGDRVSLAGLEGAPLDVQSSKLMLGGPIAFTSDGGTTADPGGGAITGLDTIDDALVIAKRSKIYVWDPTGPNNTSVDNTQWQIPSLRTADCGFTNPTTTVEVAGETEQGVMFRSLKGFRIMDRSETVRNIGWPVKGYDGLTMVGAAAPRLTNEVRFYSFEGTQVVFDSRGDRWSTYTGPAGVTAATSWDGDPTAFTANGDCYVAASGSFKDGDDYYSLSITTPWIEPGGLQGISRVRQAFLFMEYRSPHTLRFEAQYDYRDAWTTVKEVPTDMSLDVDPFGGPPGFGSGSFGGGDYVYQLRFDLPRQRCQAVRFRISDVALSGSGEGYVPLQLKVLVSRESERPGVKPKKRA